MLLISIVCSSVFGLMVLNKVAEHYNNEEERKKDKDKLWRLLSMVWLVMVWWFV